MQAYSLTAVPTDHTRIARGLKIAWFGLVCFLLLLVLKPIRIKQSLLFFFFVSILHCKEPTQLYHWDFLLPARCCAQSHVTTVCCWCVHSYTAKLSSLVSFIIQTTHFSPIRQNRYFKKKKGLNLLLVSLTYLS